MNIVTSRNTLGSILYQHKGKLAALAFIATLLIIGGAILSSTVNAVTMTTVRPDDVRPISEVATGPAGWYETATGTGNVELNSNKAYNVAGSAEFTVADSSSYVELGLYKQLSSVALSSLSGISYATWQQVDNTKAVALQVGVDTDVTDADTSWQGRLVYEPYMNTDLAGNPVTDGTWQTWLTLDADAVWWMTWSASLTTKYGANPCPQGDPCTYAEILGLFPNAGFNAGFGNPLVLKAGSGWASFTGYADAPTVSDSFWDFEPAVVAPVMPTTKDQCKNYGWQNYGATFKNQGSCVSYVATKQDN